MLLRERSGMIGNDRRLAVDRVDGERAKPGSGGNSGGSNAERNLLLLFIARACREVLTALALGLCQPFLIRMPKNDTRLYRR